MGEVEMEEQDIKDGEKDIKNLIEERKIKMDISSHINLG